MPRDGEAEARSAEFLRRGRIGLAERLEVPAVLLRAHADTAIRDAQLDRRGGPLEPLDCESELTIMGELAGIAEHIEQALLQLGAVGTHAADIGWQFHLEPVAV